MQYAIEITGMHCKGCCALIKMSMEEEPFLENVDVNIKSRAAVFTTTASTVAEIQIILQRVFVGLPGYSFNNLHTN